MYQCVAYIDREEAWQMIKPKLEVASNSFSELYFLTQNCRIKVLVNKDSEERIKTRIVSKLSDTGFIVGSLDNNYEFNVTVTYDIKQSNDLYISYPTIKILVMTGLIIRCFLL